MTTTINNEHKKLNVPNKQEKNQTCLDSAEREGLRPKGNVPNLRFPEFQGEWEKCKLGDIINFSTTRVNSSELNKDNYVSTENMLQDYQGIVKAKSVPEDVNVVSFSCDDILISNIRPYLKKVWKATFNGGCSSDVFVLKANDNIESDYLHYVIANDKFINFVMSGAKGVKMPRGDKKQMETYSLSLPQIQEQHKIARLLSLLDERISTQNKIIEDLKKLKSAISENLFKAVKGDVVILCEICEIIKGKQINGEFLSEKGKYYVMNGGTEPSGYYSDCNVEANTISISEGGNSCGYVQFNSSPFWSGGHCYTIQKLAENVDNMYLYHYLKSKEDAIMKLRIGSGLPNIQKKDLAMFKIKLPNVEQQKSISTFLSSLERKAEIEEIIQNAMLKEKQYLLEQMFI